MAKKPNNQAKNTPVAPKTNAPNTPYRQPAATRSAAPSGQKDGFISRYYEWLVVAGICVLTYLFFKEILNNQLTNWDDLGYIITNPLIKDPSMDGLKKIFSTDNPVMGNYHPLTIMLYWIEYSHYGLDPWIYHFDSLMCQILVTIAVYLFVRILTRRPVAAAVAALLFGLHPMHVETVAWAAGRKDIIYGLFYVLSLTCYVYYLRSQAKNRKIVWYSATIILFALSLLAKSVGVTLPITFFLIDLLEGRTLFVGGEPAGGNLYRCLIGDRKNGKFNYALFLEKLPHLGLAFLFGVLSIHAQKNIGALGTLDVSFTPMERIAIAGYNVVTYLWKAVLPVGMCNFYPYPMKVNDALPGYFYLYPLVVLGFMFVVFWLGRKNKILVFGIGFFLVNIALLLQLIPVGGAVMSDRYTYLPYLGLFVIAGWFVSGFFEKGAKRQTGYILVGVTAAYSMVYGYMTNEQCKVWYDSVSLWRNDIELHPANPVSYFYLGQEYYSKYEAAVTPAEQKKYEDSAQHYFMASIERKPDYINPIICLAELQRSTNQIDAAKSTYIQAMQINAAHTSNKVQNKDESVYLGLAVIYSIKRQYDSAEYCFREALSLKAYFPEAYSNYANFLDITGKLDSSLKYYAIAIQQNPDAVIPYMNRARIMMLQNKPDAAIPDYNRVIGLKPEKADAYYLRSKAYNAKGDKKKALQDVEKAKSLGFPGIDAAYYESLKS